VATHRRNFTRGVAGKVIKKIETGVEEGQVFIDIQFTDKTSCAIYVGPAQVKVERAQIIGWKNGDSFVIKETDVMETLFPLGQILATPGVLEAVEQSGDRLVVFVLRHAAGDWGDLSHEDMRANADALKEGTRLLSAYHLKDGTKIWLITEWDRSATTALLPEEY